MEAIDLNDLTIDQIIDAPNDQTFVIAGDQLAEFQLRMIKKRFAELEPRIPALAKLANLQGVSEIDSIDDVVPILFKHTNYKSYPMSLIEKQRFQALTKWLGQHTSIDLSGVDASGCRSIDQWFEMLDRETPLAVVHSTGTTGKLSIIPRTKAEFKRFGRASLMIFRGFGGEPDLVSDLINTDATVQILYPSYRYGRQIGQRATQEYIELIGDPAIAKAMYDEFLSADVSSLAGRVRAAEERGALDELEIDPDLLAKYRESMNRKTDVAGQQKAFFEYMLENCRGKRVMTAAVVPYLWDWTKAGEEQGLHSLFAPNSIFTSGGGLKGSNTPADWRVRIERFLGAPLNIGYGMTESMSGMRMCKHGHYHPSPLLVPILLSVETGEPLPREGTQTGRFALFDLMAETYWGGFITGDRLTITYGEDCGCGRKGPYALDDIRRFTEIEGGDDKISCAGAADAQERAIEYLIERATAEDLR